MPNLWVDSFTTYVYSCRICLLEFTIVIKPKKKYKILTEKCDSYTRKATCKRGQQIPTMLGVVSQECCVRLHGVKTLTGFKLCATTSNNMQQGVQTDATSNMQQCWELLANNVASVCTQLKLKMNPPFKFVIRLGSSLHI